MSPETLPDHLVPLPDESAGRWALWRTLAVRGAGFPAADVLRIADADCAAAADRLGVAEEKAEDLRQATLEALRGELASAGKDRLDLLVGAIRRTKRGRPAAAAGLAPATAEALAGWSAAAAAVAAERAAYEAVFAAAEERLGQALRAAAGNPRFEAAILWQNRHAAETGLESFRRRPEGAGGSARDRGHAQMLASYLQRYCAKNDTIGFFGPVGWGRLSEADEVIAVRPGEDLIASRQVYFEGWAIDAIAQRLAEDAGMRPWLAPRRSPFLRREGNRYLTPNGEKVELGPLSGALMAACDGTRPAGALLRDLGPELTPDNEATLWKMLANFHAKGLIRWSFQIPLSMTPERTLRDLLLAIEEAPLRERALALLDEIVRAGGEVARAGGDVEALGRALRDLEATFTRATGRPATHAAGRRYAGRTLVHEDCRRDLDLELGAPFLAAIAPALALVLASARWLTHFVAQGHRETFAEAYAQLSREGGSPQVDVLRFARAALPRLVNREVYQAIEGELQARWERVLAVPAGARRVARDSAELRPRALQEFAAPGPGWAKARYHSPDLLIAAESVEAIRRGDYEVVLGEIHVAINTLDRALFFSQHPHPERLRAAIESDLPEPCVIPVLPKIWTQEEATTRFGLPVWAVNGRMDLALRSPKDFYLDISLDPPGFPLSQLLPIGELVVEPAGGGLVVGPRAGRDRFDIVDFFQLILMVQVIGTFRVLPLGGHTPRITIDRLVVSRESWSFPAAALDFAREPTAAGRFAAARRWAARCELPRFLFAMQAGSKPLYVDLASPVLIEILAKAVRGAAKDDPEARVHLSEMLPGHGQLWLPDAQGNRYTAELRMVALDLATA